MFPAATCARAGPVTAARRAIRRYSPGSDVSAFDAARRGAIPVRETDWAPVSSSPLLAVEHPIVRVDTNDRVPVPAAVHVDERPGVRAEMVYREMVTGLRWGRGRRQTQGPVGSPIGQGQSPAGRPWSSVPPTTSTAEGESRRSSPIDLLEWVRQGVGRADGTSSAAPLFGWVVLRPLLVSGTVVIAVVSALRLVGRRCARCVSVSTNPA